MARKCSVERAAEVVGGFATARKNVTIQYQGRERSVENLLALVKRDALSKGMKDEDITDVNVYIKPEDQSVFYVINHDFQGQIPF